MSITYTPRRTAIYHPHRKECLAFSPWTPRRSTNGVAAATTHPTESELQPRDSLESGGCPRLHLDRRVGRVKKERRTCQRQFSLGRSRIDFQLLVQLLSLWTPIPRRRVEVEKSPEISILSQGADKNRIDLLGGSITTRERECEQARP